MTIDVDKELRKHKNAPKSPFALDGDALWVPEGVKLEGLRPGYMHPLRIYSDSVGSGVLGLVQRDRVEELRKLLRRAARAKVPGELVRYFWTADCYKAWPNSRALRGYRPPFPVTREQLQAELEEAIFQLDWVRDFRIRRELYAITGDVGQGCTAVPIWASVHHWIGLGDEEEDIPSIYEATQDDALVAAKYVLGMGKVLEIPEIRKLLPKLHEELSKENTREAMRKEAELRKLRHELTEEQRLREHTGRRRRPETDEELYSAVLSSMHRRSAIMQRMHLEGKAADLLSNMANALREEVARLKREAERRRMLESGHRVTYQTRRKSGKPITRWAGGLPKLGNIHKILNQTRPQTGRGVQWVEMKIITPSLSVPTMKRRDALHHGKHVSGPKMVSVERMWETSLGRMPRMFELKRRRAGISLLVDMSGSMGWDASDLEDLLKRAPHSTVGIYGMPERNDGVLAVLAAKRFKASDEECRKHLETIGGGNGCDGPALMWLARQPGPRVWVSDGGVTGRGDMPDQALYDQAMDICDMFQIQRMDETPFRKYVELMHFRNAA